MLKMFRVKNFASFKDDTILDLRAVTYKDMKNHVIENENGNILKTLAIYGKNASGKSNLISALFYFKSFVYNQFFDDGDREEKIDVGDKLPVVRRSTFKLSNHQYDDSEFEIIFIQNNKTFQYGFNIQDSPDSKNYSITEEWLYINDKLVFERKNNNITPGKKYQKDLKGIERVKEERLYIGVLDYFGQKDVEEFKEFLKNKFYVYFELILEGSVKGFVSGFSISKRLKDDEKYKNTVENFLKVADVGIVGLCIEDNLNESTKDNKPFEIKTVHNVFDENGDIVGTKLFELGMESAGTIRYFSFIQHVLDIIDDGGIFIVDELSARLHPVLTKFIVDLFYDEMNKNAQLIFTTHDISLMNNKQFRRDEIAFVEKNNRGESTVYTLADIKARSDASFSKDYLAGKYGAIPVIHDDEINVIFNGE